MTTSDGPLTYCFAQHCQNYHNKYIAHKELSFHKFPSKTGNKTLYKKWVEFCEKDVDPSPDAIICSAHFTDDMINTTLSPNTLKKGAVPSIKSRPKIKVKRGILTKGTMCFVKSCKNYKNKFTKAQGISFHKFPSKTENYDLYMEWIRVCKRPGVEPSSYTQICSEHFPSDMICKTASRNKLREGAVPRLKIRNQKANYNRLIKKEDPEVPERLPSKRKIKPKFRDDDTFEWGPRSKRILVRRVSGELTDTTNADAGKCVVKRVNKRPHENENEVPDKNSRPVKRKRLNESLGKKKKALVSRKMTKEDLFIKTLGLRSKSRNQSVNSVTEIKSEVLSDEELDDDYSREEELDGDCTQEESNYDSSQEELEGSASTTMQLESLLHNPNHSVRRGSRCSDDEALCQDNMETMNDQERQILTTTPKKPKVGGVCFVSTCALKRSDSTKEDGISFHRFPVRDKSPDRFSIWVEACKNDRKPTVSSTVCSRHFEDAFFERNTRFVTLKAGAVPTIFDATDKLGEISSQESPNHGHGRNSKHSDTPAIPKKEKKGHCFVSSCLLKRPGYTKDDSISFHKFPDRAKSPERYSIWVEACGSYKEPGKYSAVCSRHFEDAFFDKTNFPRLKYGAVPTIFDSRDKLVTHSIGNPVEKDETPVQAPVTPRKDRIIPLSNNRMYFEFSEPKSKVILKVKPLTNSVEMKTSTLEELLNSLKLKHLLNRGAGELLETFRNFPQGLVRKKSEASEKSVHIEYTKEVIKFATLLYVNSLEAYDLVNTEVMLPDVKKMRDKLKNQRYWPGFTEEAIRLLKNDSANKSKKLCSIMIDFVTLKKQFDFDKVEKRWIGHVDFCSGPDPSDSNRLPAASEIVVFTVVGLVSEWKIPFGYFPVDGISGEVLHNLVNEAIIILEECGLKVKVLVCEESPQTLKMATLFGCNMQTKTFSELVTSFPHPLAPHQRIHFVFGISHSLVLLKNLLAEKRVLQSSTYGVIKWEYLETLMDKDKPVTLQLEESEELKSSILEFQSLCGVIGHCQSSFNASVNRAFELASDLNLKEFEGSEPVANLLADVQRAFDALNARNPVTTGEKPPIKNPYMAEQLEAMLIIAKRIFGLETSSGVYIAEGGWWISVLLLPFILKSVSAIASELLSKNLCSYFTTYRVNLDHSDLILRRIQKCGGWRDTPTAAEFRDGYKVFFESCVNSSPIHAFFNDFDGDDITIGQGIIWPLRRPLPVLDEMDGVVPSQYLTDCSTNVILMARYVIRNMSFRLSCPECVALLLDNDFDSKFGNAVPYDYVRPSRFMKTVLKTTEKQLKVKLHESNTLSEEHLVVDSFHECLDLFGESYHNCYDHILEEPHHVLCLTKSVIKTYLNYKLSTPMLTSVKTWLLNSAR